ncbi:GNAT family N-acetyltransferase [Bradyrhizobium sp. 2TAF24]|uniref:GNAT family N-acetyltransferase n=1 Tax=Bradyrhizobium sp. 2TAF24 TaxID=3233011 RepID=UPI003F924D70
MPVRITPATQRNGTASARGASPTRPGAAAAADLAGSRRCVIRRGTIDDARAIAKLAGLAGGDTFTFLLRELDPTADPLRISRDLIAAPTGTMSHRHALVAVSRGQIVGMASAFPARLIQEEAGRAPPTEREALLRPRTELCDPGSYFLNDIAVARGHRRSGIGEALLGAVIDDARRQSFPSVTLHVWADNAGAIALYRRAGFEEVGRAEIPWHPELRHAGGSLLFRRLLAPPAE